MKDTILEVCVDSVESAVAAARGGADRIELCSSLITGGISPSVALFRTVRKYVDIPIRVMIRPREGDFCYSGYEFETMKNEIEIFLNEGADAFVSGIVNPYGDLDKERMEKILNLCRGKEFTLHRAFDVCRDPFKTMDDAIELGIGTILTSGCKNNCMDGIKLLGELKSLSKDRIDILAGSGVSPSNIQDIYNKTGITSFHMSGKKRTDSRMIFRNSNLNMGSEAVDEYAVFRTSKEQIVLARKAMDMLF